jgi:hypothetical protein
MKIQKVIALGVTVGLVIWLTISGPNFVAFAFSQQVRVLDLQQFERQRTGPKASSALLNLQWEYEVAGQRLTCTRYCLFRGNSVPFSELPDVEALVVGNRKGESTTGYVSTLNPKKCWLVADWANEVNGFLLSILFGLFLCLTINSSESKRQ